jgi:hypothetical protein
MNEKKLAPKRKPTALEPATVLKRNSRMGNSGASARDSITKNVTSRAAAATSIATVRVAPQPICGASETA